MKLLLILSLLLSAHGKGLIYTIEDLKVLHAEKSYAEYIKHALDIRPVQRDEKWKSMTKEMSYGLLENLSAKKTLVKSDFPAPFGPRIMVIPLGIKLIDKL